jgi:2-haloacid dehalogenase
MSSNPISGIKACVFDAYGTLFNVHSAVAKHHARLGNQADRLSALWRQKQLEYTWLRSLMGQHRDFHRVTEDALDYALAVCGVEDSALRHGLVESYRTLDPYPEVADTLRALKERGIQTAILSNGSPDMLAAAVSSAGLDGLLDAVLSVESVGIYKPDPRVYQLAVDVLDVRADEILFHSSNAWDVAGAVNFGFQVAWINRFGQPAEPLSAPPAAELHALDQTLGLLGTRA